VPSGIDLGLFRSGRRSDAVRARLGARPDDTLILSVSRLAREKNLQLLLEAVERAVDRPVKLALVGGGPAAGWLQAQAQERGVRARVHFTGELPRNALPDIYPSADAFSFTSVSETQGLVLPEALAAGLPVVAADSAASRDVLAGAGRIVPADPAAVAAALRQAVAAGRDQGAIRLAYSRFTVEMQTRRILELYRGVMAARAA